MGYEMVRYSWIRLWCEIHEQFLLNDYLFPIDNFNDLRLDKRTEEFNAEFADVELFFIF